MFRYLPGIVLVQVVSLALFWANQDASFEQWLLRAGVPLVVISSVTALWLSTLGRMEAERRSASLREAHATEREKLNREIERTRADVLQQASADKAQMMQQAHSEREHLVRQTHKQLLQRERSISRRANLKVGLAFMAVTAIGVLMLVTELMTLGLLTITTAGGAMGGYLLRWRQSRQAMERLSRSVEPQLIDDDDMTETTHGRGGQPLLIEQQPDSADTGPVSRTKGISA